MIDKLDMCDAVATHKVRFVLNPAGEWAAFPNDLRPFANRVWHEIKYFLDGDGTINPEISTVPDDCGGIYAFVIKPEIVPEIHLYLAYIGRAQYTTTQNLQKRVREYAKETERLKINKLKKMWGSYLYLRYLPLDNNDLIVRMEKELLKATLPPFNELYPEVYTVAMRAAF